MQKKRYLKNAQNDFEMQIIESSDTKFKIIRLSDNKEIAAFSNYMQACNFLKDVLEGRRTKNGMRFFFARNFFDADTRFDTTF